MPSKAATEVARRKQLRTFLSVLNLHGDLIRRRGTKAEHGLQVELRAKVREVTPELSALYTRLLRQRKYPLARRIEAGTCTGCWMKLPASLVSAIRRVDTVLHCPSCHRVLFSTEWLEIP